MISTKVFGTTLKIKATVLPNVLLLWGGVTWLGIRRHPERRSWQSLLIGFVESILLLRADIGHAIAHIFSARWAGAPMDEIVISTGMPRTLYRNNDVTPDVHRLRALGGPIYNLMGLWSGLAIHALAPRNSIGGELVGWSALGHGLLLVLSLSPVPIVDGGTLLKWTLVARGKTPSEADRLLRRVTWEMGIAATVLGVGSIARRRRSLGVGMLGIGAVVGTIAAGRIR